MLKTVQIISKVLLNVHYSKINIHSKVLIPFKVSKKVFRPSFDPSSSFSSFHFLTFYINRQDAHFSKFREEYRLYVSKKIVIERFKLYFHFR